MPAARPGSKTAQVVAMLQRKNGATAYGNLAFTGFHGPR
jgi:hypothetical protein